MLEFAPALATGLAGMRRNLVPGLVLWAIGIAVLGGYYLIPALRPAFTGIASWKNEGGLLASALLIAVAGGVVPFLVLLARGRVDPAFRLGHLLALVFIWAWRGAEIDLFYRLQSVLFGDGVDLATLIKKVVVDQALYTVLWGVPVTFLLSRWLIDHRGRFRPAWASLDRTFWRVDMPGLIIAAWMVWIPMVCIINSLPADLRVPMLAIAVVFWSLCVAAAGTPAESR